MAYTVKKLAKLSGVSIRTLHFYDEIGLLKAAFRQQNNYRCYEEEQLLLLQQILFFRALGFPLDEIKRIMSSDDFDKIEALQAHKRILNKRLDETKILLKTVDKTLAHLRGKTLMKDEELFYGFDSEKQKVHEQYLVAQGIVTQEFMNECNQKINAWSDKEKNAFLQDVEKIMDALVVAMEKGLTPSSKEVQQLMQEHYVWLMRSWTPTKERYLALAELYQTPEFRVFYDRRHPDLLQFVVKAMEVFAEQLR